MAYDRAWEGLLVSTCYHQRGFEDWQTPLALNDHGALLRVLGLGGLCHCSYRLTTLRSKRVNIMTASFPLSIALHALQFLNTTL